jgi:hypothetical protein
VILPLMPFWVAPLHSLRAVSRQLVWRCEILLQSAHSRIHVAEQVAGVDEAFSPYRRRQWSGENITRSVISTLVA